MTRDEMHQIVEVQAGLLGPRLYEGMSFAIQDAAGRAKGLDHTKYPHLRPLLTRSSLREHLEAEGLPARWQIGGNPSLMGQLYLSETTLGLKLRVLKERRRTYPGGVPIAGLSPTRRLTWQAPLFPISAITPPAQVPVNELLLLWDYADKDKIKEGFTLRIVHTVEAGQHGRPVRCDIDFAVKTGGTIFENLTFTGDADEENFFATEAEIDDAETDG